MMEKDAAASLLQRLQGVKSSMGAAHPRLQAPAKLRASGVSNPKGFWDALFKSMPQAKREPEKKDERREDDPRKKRLALLLLLSQRKKG